MLLQQSAGGFAGAIGETAPDEPEKEEEIPEAKIVMDAIWMLDSNMFHLQMRSDRACVISSSQLFAVSVGFTDSLSSDCRISFGDNSYDLSPSDKQL